MIVVLVASKIAFLFFKNQNSNDQNSLIRLKKRNIIVHFRHLFQSQTDVQDVDPFKVTNKIMFDEVYPNICNQLLQRNMLNLHAAIACCQLKRTQCQDEDS